MTSGQDGAPHDGPGEQSGQGGTPQGWGPPPSQPYGQPQGHPYGQQQGQPYGQPYGQPQGQPYGYAPAPPPPVHHGAPPAMERPTTVRAGIGAFVASMVLGLIGSVVTFAQLDDLVAEQMGQVGGDAAISDDMIRSGLILGASIGLIFLVLEVLVLWFAWQGRNWARIVLWILGGLGILSGLAGLAGDNPLGGFVAALGVFQLLLTIAGVVLLALKPSNEWYRYRGWQRANGQR